MAYCWGWNKYGQLGDGRSGDQTDRIKPVAALGGRKFSILVTGRYHSCGLDSSGSAYCWGANTSGQLGDGTRELRAAPVAVSGRLVFTTLAAGWQHTCGIVSNGMAYCWGYNANGQLGDGHSSPIPAVEPVAVAGGIGFKSLAAGQDHTCGLTLTGSAYCWGVNFWSVLGDGTSGGYDRLAPGAVTGNLRFASLVAGSMHTCGLTSSGTAHCWGVNWRGQLGDGSKDAGGTVVLRPTPVAVDISGITTPTTIASPTVLPSSTPTPTVLPSPTPTATAGASPSGTTKVNPTLTATTVLTRLQVVYSSISAGAEHTCGLTSAGKILCWGSNVFGQLGDGSTTNHSSPAQLVGDRLFTSLSSGRYHTCAISLDSSAWCWGQGSRGQLGDHSLSSSSVPVMVYGNLFKSVSSGGDHTCGIDLASISWCWGENQNGQLGEGSYRYRFWPWIVVNVPVLSSIQAGKNHTCALDLIGQAWCWGLGQWGQLGSGPSIAGVTPQRVLGGRRFLATASMASADHSCAIADDASLWCWGKNSRGQLGIGSSSGTSSPAMSILLGAVISVSAGGEHTCAINNVLELWCWGSSTYGQTGISSPSDSLSPMLLSSSNGLRSVSSGDNHSCALTNDGDAWCWGRNDLGQLGDGTTENTAGPVKVLGQRVTISSFTRVQHPLDQLYTASPSAAVISTPTVMVPPTTSPTTSITPRSPEGTVTAHAELLTQTLTPSANSSPSVITQVNP